MIFLQTAAFSQDLGKDKPLAPAEQYRALLTQFQRASGGGAASDEERLKLIGRVYKLRYELARQFLELAEKYPRDPIAVDALAQVVWQVNGQPWPVELVGTETSEPRALALLERDHIGSAKLGAVSERISFGYRAEYETFLRAVLAKSPHNAVRAQACLGLAHFLTNRVNRLDLIGAQPELAHEFAGLFGKEYLEKLQRQDRAQVRKEAKTLYEEAVRDYGAEKHSGGGTVGAKAQAGLYELRHLTVGAQAPDIEGVDQDGLRLKLSDYRGKVVLLDFWHQA